MVLRQIIFLNTPTIINRLPSSGSNDVRLFVAAKEVETMNSLRKDEKINKFDLVIDWGWFYFFTKTTFFRN